MNPESIPPNFLPELVGKLFDNTKICIYTSFEHKQRRLQIDLQNFGPADLARMSPVEIHWGKKFPAKNLYDLVQFLKEKGFSEDNSRFVLEAVLAKRLKEKYSGLQIQNAMRVAQIAFEEKWIGSLTAFDPGI